MESFLLVAVVSRNSNHSSLTGRSTNTEVMYNIHGSVLGDL